MEERNLHLLGATGVPRSEMYEGREHLVVPVVALIGDNVIHAVNAETPEFVPKSTVTSMPHGWNGRPLVLGHPVKNGHQISANDPKVIEKQGFGFMSSTHVNGARLGTEAWVDPEKLKKIGGTALLERLQSGDPVEVSVGAFVTTNDKTGTHKGKSYKSEWTHIAPDHLAFLPNSVGACSLEMGCGTGRFATHLVTAEGIEDVPEDKIDEVEARLKVNAEALRQAGGPGSGPHPSTGNPRPGSPHPSRSPEANRAIKTVRQAFQSGGNMADDYHEHSPEDFQSGFGLKPHEANAVANVEHVFAGEPAPYAEHAGAAIGERSRHAEEEEFRDAGGPGSGPRAGPAFSGKTRMTVQSHPYAVTTHSPSISYTSSRHATEESAHAAAKAGFEKTGFPHSVEKIGTTTRSQTLARYAGALGDKSQVLVDAGGPGSGPHKGENDAHGRAAIAHAAAGDAHMKASNANIKAYDNFSSQNSAKAVGASTKAKALTQAAAASSATTGTSSAAGKSASAMASSAHESALRASHEMAATQNRMAAEAHYKASVIHAKQSKFSTHDRVLGGPGSGPHPSDGKMKPTLAETARVASLDAYKFSNIANATHMSAEHLKAGGMHAIAAAHNKIIGNADLAASHTATSKVHYSKAESQYLRGMEESMPYDWRSARDFPQAKRDKMNPADFAGPHESFPIQNQEDVDNAAGLYGHAANPEAVKAKIIEIAKRKGLSVPDAWKDPKAATSVDEPFEPEPYHVDPDETVVCPNCGRRDAPDASFCDQCGYKLAGSIGVAISSPRAAGGPGSGPHPGSKDHMRIADIKTKAAGNRGKEIQLAKQMANSIKDPDKAQRRASAATQAGAHHLATIFATRVGQLTGPKHLTARAERILDAVRGLGGPGSGPRPSGGRGPVGKAHANAAALHRDAAMGHSMAEANHGDRTSMASTSSQGTHEDTVRAAAATDAAGSHNPYASEAISHSAAANAAAARGDSATSAKEHGAAMASHQQAAAFHDKAAAKAAARNLSLKGAQMNKRSLRERVKALLTSMKSATKFQVGDDVLINDPDSEHDGKSATITTTNNGQMYNVESEDGDDLGMFHQSKLTAAEGVRTADMADGDDTPSEAASEEAAELIGYQTLKTLLDQLDTSHDLAAGIVADLISDETENPATTPEDEEAEEEVEAARLSSVQVLCMSMYSTLNSIMSLVNDLQTPDDDEIGDAAPPRYMEGMTEEERASVRAALGARHSASDNAIIQSVHDGAVALGADCSGMKTAAAAITTPCGCGNRAAEGDTMTKEVRAATIKTLLENPKAGFTKEDQAGLELLPEKTLLAFEALAKADAMAADKTPADSIIQNKANADAALAAHAHGLNAKDQAEAAAAAKAAKDKADADAADAADAASKAGKQKAAEQRALAIKASGLSEAEFEEQEYLKSAPASVRTLVERQKAADTARKTELVASLKAAQAEYTEDELKAEPLERLERMARAMKLDAPVVADYSGRGLASRPASDEKDVYSNPPDPYAPALAKRRGEKPAVN